MASSESSWVSARQKALQAKQAVARYFSTKSASEFRPNANLTLISLAISIVGFLGVAILLYNYKFHGAAGYYHGFPLRVLFALSMGLAVAPFFVSILHRVSWVFVILPTILVSLLYPLLSPFGIPYDRDPIYLFQFSNVILSSGQWLPNFLVVNQAETYSFFPGAAIFNAEFSSFTGIPLVQSYIWGQPVLRLLLLPLTIYALASRLFGTRAALLGVLLYMAVPSIEMNIATQQDFALPFFALSLLGMAFILDKDRNTVTQLRILVVLFSSFVIISHHLTSYIVAGWLGALVLLPFLLRGRDPYPVLRTGRVAGRYFLVFLFYAFVVSYSIITTHLLLLQGSLLQILNPTIGGGNGPALGASFPSYQLAWIFTSLGLIALLGFLALRRTFRKDEHAFIAMNIIMGLVLVAIAVPFLPTGFSFLALRLMEYAGLILAPAAAWYLINHFLPKAKKREEDRARKQRRVSQAWLPSVLAAGVAFLIFTGGSLVPLSSRDLFAPDSAVPIDAPRFINMNAYDAAIWAQDHMNTSKHIWGDSLVYDVYGGFGRFRNAFDPYPLFNGTTVNTSLWPSIHPGDYIVTDVLMTEITPTFPGPANSQPTAPLTPAELAKFNHSPYFMPIYENSIFTVYLIAYTPSTI